MSSYWLWIVAIVIGFYFGRWSGRKDPQYPRTTLRDRHDYERIQGESSAEFLERLLDMLREYDAISDADPLLIARIINNVSDIVRC